MEENSQSNPAPMDTQVPTSETASTPEMKDNMELAQQLVANISGPFELSLNKLSSNQLRKLITALVQFPFIEKKELDKLQKKDQDWKTSFMFGERLIFANMVKRARLEMDRVFSEVEKEKEGENK